MLYVFFQFTFVQNYLTEKTAKILSKNLNTYVSVNNVSYTVLNDIIIEDVYIEDYLQDTLFYIGKISIRPVKLRLTKKEIRIKRIKINNLNSKIYSDTSGYTNLQFFIDHIKSSEDKEKDTTGKPMNLKIDKIIIVNSSFSYYKEDPDTVLHGLNFDDLNFQKLNLKITDFHFNDDSLLLDIDKLSVTEKSGFNLKEFSTNIVYAPQHSLFENLFIEMPNTELSFPIIALEYNSTDDFSDFINKVNLDISIKNNSKLSLYDLSYLVPKLGALEQEIYLSGDFSGTISNMEVRDFSVAYNDDTRLKVSLDIIGLPDIKRAYFDIMLDTLSTTKKDIMSFKNPEKPTESLIKLPKQLVGIQRLNYNARITGMYHDFSVYSNLYTNLGDIENSLRILNDSTKTEIHGTLSTKYLQIGKLLNKEKLLGSITLKDTIELVISKDKKISGRTSGFIEQVYLNNYNYKNICIKGDFTKHSFDGKININDSNLISRFDGKIDFAKGKEEIKFTLDVDTIQLFNLNLEKKDSTSSARVNIEANIQGLDIDESTGYLKMQNLLYKKNNEQLVISQFILTSYYSFFQGQKDKEIAITSDILTGKIRGIFEFTSLIDYMKKFTSHYIPSLKNDTLAIIYDSLHVNDNIDKKVIFNFHLMNSEQFMRVFMPKLEFSNNTNLAGEFLIKEHYLNINLQSDYIRFDSIKIDKFVFNTKTNDNTVETSISCLKIDISELVFLDNFNFTSQIRDDSISLALEWINNTDSINLGKMELLTIISADTIIRNDTVKYAPLISTSLSENSIFINSSEWITKNIEFFVKDGNIDIKSFDIENFKTGQNISIGGKISKKPKEELMIRIGYFDVAELNPLLGKVTIGGALFGTVKIRNAFETPIVTSDNIIQDLKLNGIKLHTLTLFSNFDTEKSKMHVHLYTQKNTDGTSTNRDEQDTVRKRMVEIRGDYFLKTKELNFDINFEKFSLKTFQPFLPKAISIHRHSPLNGDIHIQGTTDDPQISGDLEIASTKIKVIPINVSYTVATPLEVSFNNKKIEIYETTFVGPKGIGKAKFEGVIKHNNFKDLELDLSLKPDSFLFLNIPDTTEGKFYGKLFASGKIDINGKPDNLTINTRLRTEKNTDIFVLLNSRAEIKEDNSFITFIENDTIQRKDSIKVTQIDDKVQIKGLTLNLNLEITPEAEFHLMMDETTGEVMDIQSEGNLVLKMNPFGDLELVGILTIVKGKYLFALKNIISKEFLIEKGSTIQWNGSPTEAFINITAIHKLMNVKLYDLVITEDYLDAKTPVDCKIILSEELMTPKLVFDIDLPKADQKIIQQFDHLDEQDVNKQVISLLVMGRFQPLPGLTSDPKTLSGAINPGEVISNQLTHWLSDVSDDVEMDVDYESGDDMTKDQVTAGLSVQLLNDRITVNTQVGTGGESKAPNPGANNNANKIVGDFEIEAKMTKKGNVRFKAFNRSNRNEGGIDKGPYTQGAGFLFKKDFDRIIKKKKKEPEKK